MLANGMGGAALAGPEAAARRWASINEEEEFEKTQQARRRGGLGSTLLPAKYDTTAARSISMSTMWSLATYPINMPQYGPDLPEDPKFRVLLTQTTPPILLMELNAITTYNMMDPDLSAEVLYGMDCCSNLLQMPKSVKTPLAYVVQGSGPHFCPGGNPNPANTPGHTAFTMTQYTNYFCFVRCRELAIPGVSALTGSMVGGGVAYSLNTTIRIGANTVSVCFGNLSRGAVPGMALSQNVPECLGLAGAMDLYLTDSSMSSYAALKGRYLVSMQVGNQGAKQEAIMMARRLAASPLSQRLVAIKPALDMHRYATEGHAINLSAKSGVLFSNVAKKPKSGVPEKAEYEERAHAADEPVVELLPSHGHEIKLARPKRRPKRRARPKGI